MGVISFIFHCSRHNLHHDSDSDILRAIPNGDQTAQFQTLELQGRRSLRDIHLDLLLSADHSAVDRVGELRQRGS